MKSELTKRLSDLERARQEGISLTELRRRREEATRQIVEPAIKAFRDTLRRALVDGGEG